MPTLLINYQQAMNIFGKIVDSLQLKPVVQRPSRHLREEKIATEIMASKGRGSIKIQERRVETRQEIEKEIFTLEDIKI